MKPDIIVADDEGYEIELCRVKRDVALQFRQLVEKYTDHDRGEIRNQRRQEILDKRAGEWALSSEKVAAIVSSVLEPSRRRLKSLERYRQEFEEEAERQYPLDEETLDELREWQQEILGLEDSDVEGIRAEISARYRDLSATQSRPSEPQKSADYSEKLERYRQEFTKAVQIEYPLSQYALDALRQFQEQLGLEHSDIESIEQPIQDLATVWLQPNSASPPEPTATPTTTAANSTTSAQSRQDTQQLDPKAPALTTVRYETARIIGVRKTGGILGVGGQVICDIDRESQTAQVFTEDLGNGITLDVVEIPGGRFRMGSPEIENGSSGERPQHAVTVASFFMGQFSVTQAQYEAVMGENPSTKYDADRFVAPNKPVVGVSWHDAVAFCEKLSEQTGRPYRLPSEAEWEYACRAGTETPFYFGETITTDLANYNGNSAYGNGSKGKYREKLTAVGSFPANGFGLFDMHGNVWEWCLDHWHENYQGAPSDGSAWNVGGEGDRRVRRGGSWGYDPRYCRSACRSRNTPDIGYFIIGFRVCCSPPRASS